MKKYIFNFLKRGKPFGASGFLIAFSFLKLHSQTITITSPIISPGNYCAGANVTVSYSVSGTFLNVPAANVFSAQVSDELGSFAGTPVTIGTRTATNGGNITCTLPSTLLTSSLYRFRVISSNPPVNGSDNGANLTILAISVNAPVLTQTSFCQSESFTTTISFATASCSPVNIPSANVFSVQLSNAAGSFTNPITVGTKTASAAGTIPCVLPAGTPAGTGYRIRVVASNPSIVSPDNGSDLTVMVPVGTPSVFGNAKWNVYCYNARNDYTNNYQGFYTEPSLSFNTTTRWATSTSPSAATATTGGAAYSGCTFGSTNYSVVYKRTNIPCGYYQIDIPSNRTEVNILINGTSVSQFTTAGGPHTNVWTGIIDPSDEIECRMSSLNSNGNLAVTFTKLSQLSMSTPVTVCANTNASLAVTNTGTVPLTYAWTPSTTVSPTTGTAVVATPSATTIYTVTATDAGGTGCALFTNTITITVAPLPVTTTSLNTPNVCSGLSTASITASGANTYTWLPAAGLNTTTGNGVIASPTITTTYTVIGSNNCATVSAVKTVTVKNVPAAPSPTTYGNGTWNVFCYNSTNFTNFYGYYTENNLTFDSRNRWSSSSSPSIALTTTAGAGYQGCNLVNTSHSTISKRTNFPCGYYSISIGHDDNTTLFVDNVQVFQHIGGGDTHANVWQGFLGPSSTIDIEQANTSGTSYITATLAIVTVPALSPPVTICAGTTATLTAGDIAGTTYSWAPANDLDVSTGTICISSTPVNTNYTCTITDSLTGCSASSSTSVTINPVPTTTISAISSTINCQAQTYTLIASGANTYTWSPATGLSSGNNYSVVASPTVNTTYTVTGSNNCTTSIAVTNVVVVPLVNPTVYPTGNWNAYCYNSTTFTNYFGYYTENGTGTSGYDFNTATRWASGASPSTTNTSSGQAYLGCPMPTTVWSISFKRTGFTCNTYSIQALNNDDNVTLFINGVQVSTRAASAASVILWVGVLSASTTVELRLIQNTSSSGLSVAFLPATNNSSLSIWCGSTSNNWFDANNWCGSNIPSVSDDVIIYNKGTLFQPMITGGNAACNNLTISASAAATSSTPLFAAASLTMSGAVKLDVYGHWLNSGTFIPGTGTVSLLGSGTKSINCAGTQTFNTLVINNSGDLIMSSGIHKINSNMNLTSGVITSNGTLQFLNGSSVSNANDASYIEGPVVKFGNQAFTFPVGLNGVYRPIGISAPVSITDNFTAQYFHTSPSPPYTFSSKDASIDHVSACEYWILNRTGGSSNVFVTLSWDTVSCGVDNLADLLVARWDAGQVKWKDHGNGSTTGTTTKGTVISNARVTVFSPFTLASKTPNNVLPIQLLDFWGECTKDGALIKWSTAAERNNDYFIVERSVDGLSWKEINRTPAKGTRNTQNNYVCSDPFFSDETAYYRLTQVDKDENKNVFKIISTKCVPTVNEYRFYPNPAQNELNIIFNVSENQANGIISIHDNLGRVCTTEQVALKKGMNTFRIPVKLNPGIYFISYASATFNGPVQKLLIE